MRRPNIVFFNTHGSNASPVGSVLFIGKTDQEQQAKIVEDMFTAPADRLASVPQSATRDFYNQFPTRTLEKVRAGFERYFDMATDPTSSPYLPPDDWFTERMRLIDKILSNRAAERDQMPRELTKAWDEVDAGRVQSINRWDR